MTAGQGVWVSILFSFVDKRRDISSSEQWQSPSDTHRLVLGALAGLHDSVKMLPRLLTAAIRKLLLMADMVLVMMDHLVTALLGTTTGERHIHANPKEADPRASFRW